MGKNLTDRSRDAVKSVRSFAKRVKEKIVSIRNLLAVAMAVELNCRSSNRLVDAFGRSIVAQGSIAGRATGIRRTIRRPPLQRQSLSFVIVSPFVAGRLSR